MKKIVVVGSGFGGLSIASKLKAKKFDVTLIEKHKDLGGEHVPLYTMILNMMLAQL